MSNAILAKLTEIANICAEKMKSNVSSQRAPHEIIDAIHVGQAKTSSDNQHSVDITIPLGEAPMAAAYEWGSGEHATRGDKKKYRIPTDGEAEMFFPKADWPQYSPPPPAPDVFKFGHVMHPGVAPRPYIQPAIDDTLKEAKTMLKEEVLAQFSIIGDTSKGKHYEVIIVGGKSK